ncbi:protein translocase subunit SecD [Streptomyces sp. NPDC005955]|uniref:protein translocase subunit SecD n=1 Tax=Streptomyces sp. NPDC005955 TaxID=3364738 RepID=UPI00367CBEAB
MAAPKKGRKPSAQGKPGRTLVLILIAMVALTGGMFLSGHTTPRLGIDLAGGTSITLKAKNEPGQKNAVNQTNMETAVGIIERRVNGLGVSEAEVQTQGNDNIIVNIPRGTDEETAREQVGTTAKLSFRPVLSGMPVTESGKESPSPSPSASGDKGKAGESGKPSASSSSSASPSPSSSATTQGRAVTGALAADATPSGSASAEPSDSTSPAPSSSSSADAAAAAQATDLQKRLEALDCSTAEGRLNASDKARAAKPEDPVVACDPDSGYKYVLGPVAVEGKRISDASAVIDPQGVEGWIVQMDFDKKGADQFGKITSELAAKGAPQNQFAIVLDGEITSAPSVNTAITGGNAQISGNFKQEEAENLGNMLSYGALPLTFEEQSVTTVTAALGGEQLEAGLIAGAIGLALVVIYLVVYYRGLALIAIASLLLSAALTYVLMSLLGPAIGFALNLPAVCGAIVAIGITADSFIVFFERVRDEVREGRSLRPAVERGWPRARRTILVSDFVSFLAAAVLFIVTVGKVQGFAFTLGLTTLLDVVVVFFFTKPLLTLAARSKFFADGHPWSGFDPKRLGIKAPLRRTRRPSAPLTDPKEA